MWDADYARTFLHLIVQLTKELGWIETIFDGVKLWLQKKYFCLLSF